jgi:hypothetical protein
MDIVIYTSDPDVVAKKLEDIRTAVEGLGLFVGDITIVDRGE